MRWDTTLKERPRAETPAPVPRLRLLWTAGAAPARAPFELAAGTFPIGRAVGTEGLPLPGDPRVSRRHAELRVAGGQALLVDTSSTGTFVNGRRLEGGAVAGRALRSGDVVRVGDSFLIYRAEPEPIASEAHGLLGLSPGLRAVQQALSVLGRSGATVLILGETGTGKELAARALHQCSGRPGPLLAVNCSAISESLAESQLFGHVAGAFTGARAAAPGLLRAAHGGTLFLDEVGELPAALQPKLLRALEERTVTPVGESHSVAFDARIVAATNRSLLADVQAGTFRGDLYARLGELTLELPPLRERREDILPILSGALGALAPVLDAELVNALLLHAWPFNVRELRKVATQLSVRGQGAARLTLELFEPHLRQTVARVTEQPAALQPSASPLFFAQPAGAPLAGEQRLSSAERAEGAFAAASAGGTAADGGERASIPDRARLEELLRRSGGVIADVARETGRSRKQVYRWIQHYQLDLARYRDPS